MYRPEFPYKGNQIILSSDRIILNSKSDAIFLFGTAAVGLSSTQTINLDAKQKILLDAPKIQLGREAEVVGEPVVLGGKLTDRLIILLDTLSQAGVKLANVSQGNLGASMQLIALAGAEISKASTELSDLLNNQGDRRKNSILSKTTFTR